MSSYNKLKIERADTIHLISSKEQNEYFFNQIKFCVDTLLQDENTKEFY